MPKMTKEAYKKYADKKSPKSPIVKDIIFAFLIGGTICCIGQGISDLYTNFTTLTKDEVGAVTSVTLIFLGALFTGLGWYDNLAKYAGAGTIVPITGFANSIVSPAMEFKSEGYILGMSANMFKIAGPVIVFGVVFSVIAGVLCFLFGWY